MRFLPPVFADEWVCSAQSDPFICPVETLSFALKLLSFWSTVIRTLKYIIFSEEIPSSIYGHGGITSVVWKETVSRADIHDFEIFDTFATCFKYLKPGPFEEIIERVKKVGG